MAEYSSGRNYLGDDDDIDDDDFLRQSRNSSGFMLNDGHNNLIGFRSQGADSLEEKRQELLQKKREIEQRTISSTERSLNYLRNSEEVGAATAEELYRQREQLERTEKRLNDITTTLRFSQRHIQGIKSVFGGLKNLIRSKAGTLPPTSSKEIPSTEPTTSNNLFEVVDRNNAQKKMVENSSIHPGLKIRGLYDTDESTVLESKAQDVIDRNLDQMLNTIQRLKGLSYNLGDEIESQNDLIDKVIDKTEKAECSIQKQNKDMTKLLK